MGTLTKERNILTFALDGKSGVYRFDINTCTLYGIKGNPVKTNCNKTAMRILLNQQTNYHGGWSHLERVIYTIFDICSRTEQYASYATAISTADKIDALDITVFYNIGDYEYISENFKLYAKYMKENPNANFQDMKRNVEFEKAKKELGGLAEQLTPEIYYCVKQGFPNITKQEWECAIYYLIRGKMWEYENHSITSLIQYFEWCRAMNVQPKKENNFMREYVETKLTYERKKIEYDNNRIKNNYEKHAKAFDFTYGNYTVIIPKSGQEIIDEGNNMHHCVGSYVHEVVNNRTYIVFIRRTDTPDQCYITCQVSTYGQLQQYFLAYDRYISSDEDKAFQLAFAKHLKENW